MMLKKLSVTLQLAMLVSFAGAAVAEEPQTFSQAYEAFQQAAQEKSELAEHYARLTLAFASKETLADSNNYYALHYNLGNALRMAGKIEEAIAQFDELQASSETLFGEYSMERFAVRAELISLKKNLNSQRLTKAGFNRELYSFRRLINDLDNARKESPQQAAYIYYTVLSLLSQGANTPLSLRRTQDVVEQAVTLANSEWGPDDVRTLHMQFLLGKLTYSQDKLDDAVEVFTDIATRIDERLYYSHPWALKAHALLVNAYSRLGEEDLATEHCRLIGSMTPWDDEQEPQPIFRINPKYPVAAARAGKEGFVVIEFDIDEDGFVREPQVLDYTGHKQFAKAAMAVLEDWRYAPKFDNGKAVLAANQRVQLDFKLAH